MFTVYTCPVNPVHHRAGVNSPSHRGGKPWFPTLVESPGKGQSSHLLGSFVSVPVFVHVQMAPSLSGLLLILFGKLLAVWDCICSLPSIQRHADELINSTEQLINLFTSVLGPAGMHERNPSGIALWPCVAPGAFLSLLLLSVELAGWTSWFLKGLSLF